MHDNLIILAGGASSRMKKAAQCSNVSQEDITQANQRTKGLISVGDNDRPILDYLLFNAKKAGYKNVYIVVSEKGLPSFKSFYGNSIDKNSFKGLNITYAIQYIPEDRVKPLGTADALFQVLEQYPALKTQFFTVCNSDNLYSESAFKFLRDTTNNNAFINYNRDALQFSQERIARFAITKLNSNGYLVDIIEKPDLKDVEINKDKMGKIGVSMNIFKLSGNDFYKYLNDCPLHPERNEKELPVALLNMVKDGGEVFGIPLSEHVPDLTAKDDIAIVRTYLLENYSVLNW